MGRDLIRLGRAEQIKLEAHLDALRSIERSLEPPAEACNPAAPASGEVYDNEAFPTTLRQQMQIATNALSCGLTRVVTLQCAHTIAPTVFSWLGIGEGHHSLSHAGDSATVAVNEFIETDRWKRIDGISVLLLRPTGQHPNGHTGATVITHGSDVEVDLQAFIPQSANLTTRRACDAWLGWAPECRTILAAAKAHG